MARPESLLKPDVLLEFAHAASSPARNVRAASNDFGAVCGLELQDLGVGRLTRPNHSICLWAQRWLMMVNL